MKNTNSDDGKRARSRGDEMSKLLTNLVMGAGRRAKKPTAAPAGGHRTGPKARAASVDL